MKTLQTVIRSSKRKLKIDPAPESATKHSGMKFEAPSQRRAGGEPEPGAFRGPMPHETEDSRITGGTRSLLRRLLALNVGGSLAGSGRFVQPRENALGTAKRI